MVPAMVSCVAAQFNARIGGSEVGVCLYYLLKMTASIVWAWDCF